MLWLIGLWVSIVLGLVSWEGQVVVTSHSTTDCTVRPIPRLAGAEVEPHWHTHHYTHSQ